MMEITSRENPLIRDYTHLRDNRAYRRETGRFVLEGARLLADALESGVRLETFFFTDAAMEKHAALCQTASQKGVRVCMVGSSVAVKLADTSAPQGIFATAFMLDKAFALDKIKLDGVYAALEDISDPGNLGTILRTAEALGLSGILLSKGCTDIYAPKVVRASMGAVFRTAFLQVDDLPAALSLLNDNGIQTLAALAGGTTRLLTQLDLHGGVVVAIGNEGAGLTDACVKVCKPFTIPMKGRAESLNAAAAAAIVMWEIMRGR
ncbi:MAG: RNA methyltransferase [Ethanoligenens sp.]